jgi:chromate transporter
LLLGTLSYWDNLRSQPVAQAMIRGVNAAVVGLLAAALYSPVWTGAVTTALDASLALVGFVSLTVWRMPPILVVVIGAAAGAALLEFAN